MTITRIRKKLNQETANQYANDLKLYRRVIQQRKDDKNKIYSLHKPFTCCIAKGKMHKPYMFGNKNGQVIIPKIVLSLP